MYSSEKNPGINWKDLIIKGIFFVLFILLLMWLFPKVPNMKSFYSNVFRENISYMQDAARSYYTNERLPKNIGDVAEMSLQDLIDKNLIIPFLDKDGNSCNTTASYVQVTKEEKEYALKVNLVCDDESSYVIETLGCHDYCDDCENNVAEVLEYQFKQVYSTNKITYSCPSGYTRNGTKCYKTSTSNWVEATAKYSEDKEEVTEALVNVGTTKTELLQTLTSNISNIFNYTCYQTETYSCPQIESYSCTKTETYSCPETKYEENCTTINVKESYKCNCVTKYVGGVPTFSCDVCYRTIPKKTCDDKIAVTVNKTCTRQVPGTCEREVDKTCTRQVPKTCTESSTNLQYYCPIGTDYQIGSGSSLKCYDYITDSNTYYCKNKDAKLVGSKCYSIVKGTITGYTCPNGNYILDGSTCYLKSTDVVNATSSTKKVTGYNYKWSKTETLEGWERTGETRKVQAEA